MDRYVGYKLLFTTPNGVLCGVLKQWDDIKEQVVICKDDGTEVIDILDIDDIEIIEDGNTEGITKSNEQHSTSNRDRQHSNSTECITKSNEQHSASIAQLQTTTKIPSTMSTRSCTGEEQTNVQQERIQVTDTINCKHSTIECKPITKNGHVSTDMSLYTVQETTYLKLISDCFNVYGPTKEEYINFASFNILKLIKNSKAKSVCIVMGKNSLYNCIGYHIGRILCIRGYTVTCIDNDINIEVLKYKHIYYNNNPDTKSTSTDRTKYDMCICMSTSDIPVECSEYWYINKMIHNKHPCVCISLGCIIDSSVIPDKWYLIDTNISHTLYEKYKMMRPFNDSSILKLH